MGFRVYWLQFPILLALFEDHMLANSWIVLAQFKSILGVISILLNEITEITFGAYQLHMRTGIFALLGHRKLSLQIQNHVMNIETSGISSRKNAKRSCVGLFDRG